MKAADKRITEIQAQMHLIGRLDLTDIEALLELHRQKPSVEWMSQIEKQMRILGPPGTELSRLRAGAEEKLTTTGHQHQCYRKYRSDKQAFQTAMKDCLEGKTSSQSVVEVINRIGEVKQLLVDAPLFDLGSAREFVAISSLYHIIKYFFQPKEEEYNKIKVGVLGLISKWEAEDLVNETEPGSVLFNNFLLRYQDRFSILGKRETNPSSQSPEELIPAGKRKLVIKEKLRGEKIHEIPSVLPSSARPHTEDHFVVSSNSQRQKESVFKKKNDVMVAPKNSRKPRNCTKGSSKPIFQPRIETHGSTDANNGIVMLADEARLASATNEELNEFSRSLTNMDFPEMYSMMAGKDIQSQKKVREA